MVKKTQFCEVRCTECDEEFDETEVEFVDIEEDDFGRDRMTFVCPVCGKMVKSFRVSRMRFG